MNLLFHCQETRFFSYPLYFEVVHSIQTIEALQLTRGPNTSKLHIKTTWFLAFTKVHSLVGETEM